MESLLPPSGQSRDQRGTSHIVAQNILRDNFEIPTWLLLGALMQAVVPLFLPPRYAICPVAVLFLWRVIETTLALLGVTRNKRMDGVIMGKYSAQVPDGQGVLPATPADKGVVVILLSTRSNHPLGMLGPGFQRVGDYMSKMQGYLRNNADKFGYLGSSSWIEAGSRTSANAVMLATYFRTVEGQHSFAHSPLHTKAWRWFNGISQTHPHLMINHEMYWAPENCWETIYVNSHRVGLGATETKVTQSRGGSEPEHQWISPLVDASRGVVRSQYGRMNRTDGSGNEKYGEPY